MLKNALKLTASPLLRRLCISYSYEKYECYKSELHAFFAGSLSLYDREQDKSCEQNLVNYIKSY